MATPVTDSSPGKRTLDSNAQTMDRTARGGQTAAVLSVFLVEDSKAVCERLTELLTVPNESEVIGYADNEGDAVEWLRGHEVDVAIVDLKLRQGSGFGVISALRALYPHPPPTIIVLTNYAFPEYEVASRARGADFFFDKSTQFSGLNRLLADLHAGEARRS
jgi:two-component system, OmpR family, response regulator